MSIPAALRDLLGFSQPGTAIVRAENNRLVVEPTRDIMSLAGILHDKIKLPKGYEKMSAQEIIDAEKESYKQGIIKRYEKSLRRR